MKSNKLSNDKAFNEVLTIIQTGQSKAYSAVNAAFERTMLTNQKLSPAVRVLPQKIDGIFKDSYSHDFLNLPEPYFEKDLQSALVANLRSFLLELGDGFSFIGEKVRVQQWATPLQTTIWQLLVIKRKNK